MSIIKQIETTLQAMKGRIGDLAAGFFVAILVRLIALVPLVALFTKVPMVAVLTPLLIVFLVMPQRLAMAQALNDFAAGGKLFTPQLVNFEGYKAKMLFVFKQMLKLLPYFVALFAMLGYLGYLFVTTTDSLDLMRMLVVLGGGIERGILYLALIMLACCLPIMIGAYLHSADRFAFVTGEKIVKPQRKQCFMAIMLSSLLLLLPLITIAVYLLTGPAYTFLITMFKDKQSLKIITICSSIGLVYYLLTLPVRKLLLPVMLKKA